MGADGVVRASITSGLIYDREPAEENYGARRSCDGDKRDCGMGSWQSRLMP